MGPSRNWTQPKKDSVNQKKMSRGNNKTEKE